MSVSSVLQGAPEKGQPQPCSVTIFPCGFAKRQHDSPLHVPSECRIRIPNEDLKVIELLYLNFSSSSTASKDRNQMFCPLRGENFPYSCVQFTIYQLLSRTSKTYIDSHRPYSHIFNKVLLKYTHMTVNIFCCQHFKNYFYDFVLKSLSR